MQPNNVLKIIHSADYHTRNRNVPLEFEYSKSYENIENEIIKTEAEVYVLVGDLFDFPEQNDSERKIMYRHIAKVLNIPTLKELVLMLGNHDFPVDKKKISTLKENNAIDTLQDFIATLSPEIADKLTYCKKQKQYISKADSRLAYVPYSLEDGFSNGNNFDWENFDNTKYNITLFHDILDDYIDETGLPVSKEKRKYLPKLSDFKTRNIFAGDIHKNWSATTGFLQIQQGEVEKRFVYCGSNNQVNFGEGAYVFVRKASRTVEPDKKVIKHHLVNLDDIESYAETTDIVLTDVIRYITIDCNTKYVVPNYLKEILSRINNPEFFGTDATFIKLKLSSSYIKHEIEIHKAITDLTIKMPKVNIEIVHDKFIVETSDNLVHEYTEEDYEDHPTDDIDDSEEETLTALTNEKLLEMFTACIVEILGEDLKEDEVIDNEILERVKGIFIDQLNVITEVNKNSKTYSTQLLDIECNGFMRLGANIIDLDVSGLTRIVGTNGVGKTTLYNMLRYVIRGILFDHLKVSQKVKNTLLIFNDNYQSEADDSLYIKLRANVNATPIVVTRTATRKWKSNISDDQKRSKDWKNYISGVTTSVSIEIRKEGTPVITKVGEEAEQYLKIWFGDITDTIMILNQQRLLNMLNLPSSELQSLILKYVGVDYLSVLSENIDGIKLGFNLQIPKVNIVEVRSQLQQKSELSTNIDECERKLIEDIEANKEDIRLTNEHNENLKIQNVEFGNLPNLIENSENSIKTIQTAIDEFKPMELPEPVTAVKPVQQDSTAESTKILEFEAEIKKCEENEVNLTAKITEIYGENTTITEENNKLIEETKNSNKLINDSVATDFNTIYTFYNGTLVALKEKFELKNGEVIKLESSIENDEKEIEKLNGELSSGVCESCSRAFDETQHEQHKIKVAESVAVLSENISKNKTTVEETKTLIGQIEGFVKTYSSIVEASLRSDIVWFENNISVLDQANLDLVNKIKNSKLTLVDVEKLVLKPLITEQTESILNVRTELKTNSENKTKYQNNIGILNTEINRKKDLFITETETYNKILSDYQNALDTANKYNNGINDYNLKLVAEQTTNKTLLEKLPAYNKLQEDITVANTLTTELSTKRDELAKLFTEMQVDKTNLFNDLEKLKKENENYIEHITHKKIINIYTKIVNVHFPSAVFEYYVKHINRRLNILLENMSFKLFLDLDCELFLVDLSQGSIVYRPVSLVSGMQNIFLGLSLIYTVSMLNIKNTIGHIFVDEISGALNSGKDIDEQNAQNYQEQLMMLLSKFIAGRKVFIIDHVIENMWESTRYNVVFGSDNKSYYIN